MILTLRTIPSSIKSYQKISLPKMSSIKSKAEQTIPIRENHKIPKRLKINKTKLVLLKTP